MKRGIKTVVFCCASLAVHQGCDASATAPGIPPAEVPFESLGQAAPVGGGPDTPTVYGVSTLAGAQALADLVEPEHERALSQVDYSSNVAVAVFAGPRPSSGYSVTVEQLSPSDGRLRVVVSIRMPAPSDYVLPAFTRPYHLVQTSRAGLDTRPPSSWVLMDTQGATLASGRLDWR